LLRYRIVSLLALLLVTNRLHAQVQNGSVVVVARSGEGEPAPQVEVHIGDITVALTDEKGEASFQWVPGEIEIRLQRIGYKSKTLRTAVISEQTIRLVADMESDVVLEESIIVTATRNDTRIEDEPLRIEVMDRDEVDEKAAMTPGDIAMLLNETSGLRVQVTSPALGSANVRVQGLRGRYTQLLSDGLPLYGQVGSIGILQIPPLDLGQVEVIKGVASALYGSSALGGVINLVSRRPGKESDRQLLLNATSRQGLDAVFWLSEPPKNHWSYSLLTGAHFQAQSDIDNDQWADLPEYQRGVLRPRVFWDNETGNSIFVTTGITIEDRAGGSDAFSEQLRTRRFDTGIVGRFLIDKKLVSVRGSAMTQRHRKVFGTTLERDRQDTFFGEFAVSGTQGRHSWTLGSAFQADLYRSQDVSRFDYTYLTPALFAQDEYKAGSHVTLSASGRVDFQNTYGTFFSPRVSALFRLPKEFTARVSTGAGVFAPTPFTDETEATGLSRIQPLHDIKAERAWSSSADLGWKHRWLELNATAFGSNIRNATALNRNLEIVNSIEPIRTIGSEFFARVRKGSISLVATHTFVHSTEFDVKDGQRQVVPLTPRHTSGIDFMWEREGKSRLGLEAFYTGRQQLDENPFRNESLPYWVFGILVEHRVGAARLFLNLENISDFRQTRYEPLVRPTPTFDGRQTVDAWSPLEGRVINGGVRFSF